MSELERVVKFYPAWDKRHRDPEKNHGVHGVELLMLVKGDEGAVQFKLYTNWMLPEVQREQDAKFVSSRSPHLLCHPMPADLGYHSKRPMYEGHRAMGEQEYSFKDGELVEMGDQIVRMPKVTETGGWDQCEWTGGPCYYDGSTLNAERIYNVLLAEGSDGVWRELESYYWETFGRPKVVPVLEAAK